jgi:hypothetical protein
MNCIGWSIVHGRDFTFDASATGRMGEENRRREDRPAIFLVTRENFLYGLSLPIDD